MAGIPDIPLSLAALLSSRGARDFGRGFMGSMPNIPDGPLSIAAMLSNVGNSKPGAAPNMGAGIGSAAGQFANRLNGLRGSSPQQQTDPMMELYNQLLSQLQEPVRMPQSVNTEDLMKQIQSAINPIYDQRRSAAQSQNREGQAEIEKMYRALSNDFERLAPEQVAQAQAAQEEIKQVYGSLRSNVEGSYSRVAKEQGDLFKQLGIEAAAPDVLGEQQEQVQQTLNAASENQAQQQQRYADIGQMDSTYYREGSPNATMQGNELRTNLLDELTQYLNQIEAERTSGIQSAYNDQLNSANSMLMQQQQTAQSEAGRRQEMLWQILQSQMQGQNQKMTPDSFMSGLPQNVQQSVASAFTQLQRSPESVYGKVHDPRSPDPGSFVETTPQWYMAQADEMLRRGEITPEIHQALLMYLQLNNG